MDDSTLARLAPPSAAPPLPVDLSIVIPAFQENHKIAQDIQAAAQFLVGQGLHGEIIVVDDGSRDETARIAEAVAVPEAVTRRVIRYTPNRGKGHAVRTGMRHTSGRYVMFADSGNCVPYDYALSGLKLLRDGACELAHGSRKLPQSIIKRKHYWYRTACSRIFRRVVWSFMGIPHSLSDSQCGFKMYRGDIARSLYDECLSERFMFDVEIILRAIGKGYRIREFPIEWNSDHDSRFRLFRAGFRSLYDLLKIRSMLAREKRSAARNAARPEKQPPSIES
ncbi:MAG: glycosyltransferase [Sedimentisphaerales bacterium]|nr:glycosyltransferase [Sedimentisphaerales bacterium]